MTERASFQTAMQESSQTRGLGWRLSRRGFALLGTAAGLSGCASIPTSGPVQQISRSAGPPNPPGVRVAPDPPAPGASPDLILAGFLAACLSPANNYSAARQYLSPDAAGRWDPAAGVVVYDGEGHPPVSTGQVVSLRAPVLGTVSAEGSYTAVNEPDFQHDFTMTDVDGQWRIANPPSGLLISQYSFARSFRPQYVYFLDRTARLVVPDEVFLPESSISPTTAIQALLRGPSPWLRPAVQHLIPADVKLASPAVTVNQDGIADISLSAPIEALSAEQRRLVSAQLLWTLSGFGRITGVRVSSGGAPLTFPNQDVGGVLRLSTVSTFQPASGSSTRQLIGLVEAGLARLGESAGSVPQPIAGPLGQDWGHKPGAFAIGPGGRLFAVLNAERTALFTWTAADAQPRQRLTGSQLGRPQVDAELSVWVNEQTDSGPVLHRLVGDEVQHLALPDLAGARLVAFRIAPDQTRIALIAEISGALHYGFMRIRGTEALIVDGWSPVPVNSARGELTALSDVGWSGLLSPLVLGASQADPHQSVYAVDLAAAQVDSLGPVIDVGADILAAQPTIAGNVMSVLTADGQVLRFEDRSRWVPIADGVSQLAYLG